MSVDAPPSSDLLLRFAMFVGCVKQAIVGRLERGGDREGLGPLGAVLWQYVGRALLRLTRMQARFQAGTLRPGRARAAARQRPEIDRPKIDGPPPVAPAQPGLPRGPVLLRFHAAHLAPTLAALVDNPEMRALLAAAPQAGRLLRPLWRRLTPDPMPAHLRLPARPRPRPSTSARATRAVEPAGMRTRAARPPPHRASRWIPHWTPSGPMPPMPRRAPSPSG